MRHKLLIAALGLLAMGVAVATSCSVRYDFTECTSDADCTDFNDPSSGTFYTCSSNNTCAERDGFECRQGEGDCGANEFCDDNNQCQREDPDTGMMDPDTVADTSDTGVDTAMDTVQDVDSGPPECDTTQKCQDMLGSDYICAPRASCTGTGTTGAGGAGDAGDAGYEGCSPEVCRKVTQAEDEGPCNELFLPEKPPGGYEDIVILGTIIPTTGTLSTVGDILKNSTELAVSEFNGAAQETLNGQKIGWVQCDEGADIEGVDNPHFAAARHLVSIGAPAIVGPVRSGNYRDVVNGVTGLDEARITTIAPSATAPFLRSLSAAGELSFRTIGNDRFQAQAILDRMRILLEGQSDPSIALFYKEDAYGGELKNQIDVDVTDASWIESGDISFYEVYAPANRSESEVQQNFGTQVTNALDQRPNADVVGFFGTGETVDLAAKYIQSAANRPNADPENRRYLFSHGAISRMPALPQKLAGNESFLPLSEGVSPNVIETGNFEAFLNRYNSVFGGNLSANAASVGYDGALVALLAMAGVPEGTPVTGDTVANVISSGRLQNGQKISIDAPSKMALAKAGLEDGESVDITGVSGSLDFDDRGEVRPNYIGIDIGTQFDTVAQERTYDIIPTRRWVIDDSASGVAGNWQGLPVGLLTGKGVIAPKSPGTTIPDDDPSGLTSTASITQSECGIASVARVKVDIDHPAPEELEVSIETPTTANNNTFSSTLQTSGTSRPLDGKFPTTLVPSPGSSFNKLLGRPGGGFGDWKLTVTDTSAANGAGTLNSWRLRLDCTQ